MDISFIKIIANIVIGGIYVGTANAYGKFKNRTS